jgi:peptidoglycan/xylan/chitin deacetylase (PgdA/CDA1 family)
VNVHFTVDVEPDCPPYLNTWRGLDSGMPRLLEMLAEERIPATFFVTGDVASRYTRTVQAIVDAGHELGSHGQTHSSFARMNMQEAEGEIAAASRVLRAFAPVVSFRAPYLQFPPQLVPLLAADGYSLDSSEGRHKRLGVGVHTVGGVLRVPASVSSATLRWQRSLRNALFARLRDPIVLFVHPWEFVDLRRERLRLDCRFKTGDVALDCARSAIQFFRSRGARFRRMQDCRDPGVA